MCYLVFGGPILQLWKKEGRKNRLHISVGHWILKHALSEFMCRDVEIVKTQSLLSGMLHTESLFRTTHSIIPFLFFFLFFFFSCVRAVTSPLNIRQSQPDVHNTKVWPAANFILISTPLDKRFSHLRDRPIWMRVLTIAWSAVFVKGQRGLMEIYLISALFSQEKYSVLTKGLHWGLLKGHQNHFFLSFFLF